MEIILKGVKEDDDGFPVEDDDKKIVLTGSTRGFVKVHLGNEFAVISADELVRAAMAFVNVHV